MVPEVVRLKEAGVCGCGQVVAAGERIHTARSSPSAAGTRPTPTGRRTFTAIALEPLAGQLGVELEQAHCPEETAVDGFQAIADVGQRARGDRREGVDEVALGEGAVERGVDDGEVGRIRHGGEASKARTSLRAG